MNIALDETRERYGKLFDKKQAFMLAEVEKGKKIEELESEMRFILDSFRASKEYAENHALDFIEGLWHKEEQLRMFYLDYSMDMEVSHS